MLVARQCGAARRWYFLCPACQRPREYLYVPPDQPAPRLKESLYAPPIGDWRCRKCWNLNYASQHYGRTHALRRKLPPRRILSKRRRQARTERRREKYLAKARAEAAKPSRGAAARN